ncbi:MAG: tRNA (adenosine(37)-N6)-threonylcarbamoyltransferase complex dimerization subunit type 1 TsaB [Gemmatimonadales bacterium]|nr:tRNA (adenosine(37)-N6)-threonylcarbamoyltransferase complex dimerization subunit type 1 TsaB [Gemmatimonadales bacterium]
MSAPRVRLAVDTATDRLGVAVAVDGQLREAFVDGARRHAGALLPLADALLAELGATPADLEEVTVADGPGSFTGLRVAAAVAKALAHDGRVAVRAAPALLARGVAALAGADGTVAVTLDALRGEVYVACYAVAAGAVTVRQAPVVAPREALPPSCLGAAVRRLDDPPPAPAALLALGAMAGGAALVADVRAWEPVYGRRPEAQVKWEAAHGRALPDPAGPRG